MSDEVRSSSPDALAQTDAPRNARLDKALARTSDAPLRKNNRLELLKDGSQTFDDWLAAIGRAERWVHLENYIFSALFMSAPIIRSCISSARSDSSADRSER